MNAIMLDGSLEGQNLLNLVSKTVSETLGDASYEVELIALNKADVKGCIGCFKCWHTTPGICSGIKGDDASEITKAVIKCDLLVFLTPLTFGGYSSELKKIIERFLGLLQPATQFINGESHHVKRYDRYPSLLSLAVAEGVDEEEANLFKKLTERHSLNFYPPKHLAEVFDLCDPEIPKKIRALLAQMEPLS